MVAIRRLCDVVFVHKCLGGDRRAVGNNMIVGRIIFNIVGGLGCVSGRSRVFVWKLQVLLGRCQPHRLKMLV